MGQYIVALARIAVPIFFMISGFFYGGMADRDGVRKQIKKIARLLLMANLIYFLWKLLLDLHSGMTVLQFLRENFALKPMLKFVLLNESPFGGHLWYLGAILYVLVVFVVADRLHFRRFLYAVTPVLLLADLVFGKYSMALFGREFPYILVRNFLCVGIPYFSIGCLMKKYEKKIAPWVARKNTFLVAAVILFIITTFGERYLLVSLDMNAARDHYISSTFLAVFMFVVAMCDLWLFESNETTPRILKSIGRKYSTWVYIVHPIFITGMGIVMRKVGIYAVYCIVAPILVYIVTVVFVVCTQWIVQRCKGRISL